MISRRLLLGGLAGFAAGPAAAQKQPGPRAPRGIEVSAQPFAHFSSSERDRRIFGKLTFLGGLELRSRDPEFGGISSLLVEPDGREFVAVTDHAHWLTGRFVERDGALAGIEEVRIAAMTAPDGRRMKDTRWFDSESLARIGRSYYVGVERLHDILQFERAADGTFGRPRIIDVPADIKRFSNNAGIEGLGVLPRQSAHAGALIALGERAFPGAASPDMPCFILGPRGGQLHIRKIGPFDLTDVAFLPGGDMLILERRFVPILGVGMRIRRIPIASVRPGAVLDGEILIEADMGHQIDNMEGIGVHRGADGRVILTLVSDDNFSVLQRNLVLRFAMDE